MFTAEQLVELAQPLDAKRVAHRKDYGSGKQLSYLEGYDVIDAANRVFGYGMWERGSLAVLEHLQQQVTTTKDGKERQRYDVHVVLSGSVTVRFEEMLITSVSHHDVGYGNGSSYTGFGESLELAYKEAATDLMKRCLRAFGNQFGNSLYSGDVPKPEPQGQPGSGAQPITPASIYIIAKSKGVIDEGDVKLLAAFACERKVESLKDLSVDELQQLAERFRKATTSGLAKKLQELKAS